MVMVLSSTGKYSHSVSPTLCVLQSLLSNVNRNGSVPFLVDCFCNGHIVGETYLLNVTGKIQASLK
jgi:hypothetical protein